MNRVINAGNFLTSGASQDNLVQCNRSKSFDFGCVQICKCLWLLYGEVGKHISMENIHSGTVVWHFITVFGFCIVVSPSCK